MSAVLAFRKFGFFGQDASRQLGSARGIAGRALLREFLNVASNLERVHGLRLGNPLSVAVNKIPFAGHVIPLPQFVMCLTEGRTVVGVLLADTNFDVGYGNEKFRYRLPRSHAAA